MRYTLKNDNVAISWIENLSNEYVLYLDTLGFGADIAHKLDNRGVSYNELGRMSEHRIYSGLNSNLVSKGGQNNMMADVISATMQMQREKSLKDYTIEELEKELADPEKVRELRTGKRA